MTRTQKKCFITSAGFHLLLVVMLFVGPGFFTSTSKMEDANILTIVPMMTTDERTPPGGGSPKGGNPQPPQPEPPKPAVTEKLEKAEPPKPVVKETKPEKPETESLEPTAKPKPKVSLTPVVRKSTSSPTKPNASKSPAKDESPSKDLQAYNNTVKSIKSGMSPGTTIDMPLGLSGGGPSYANFYDGVKKVYSDAWLVPDGVTDDNATVTASVTIARSGEVTASKIVVSSGNSEVDQSVQATLNRVRLAVPLPPGAKENERTVRIKFNVRAQRLLG